MDGAFGVFQGGAELGDSDRVDGGLPDPVEQFGGRAQLFDGHADEAQGQVVAGGVDLGADVGQQAHSAAA